MNVPLLYHMFPLRIEVGDDVDFSKLCPPAGSRIAFDRLPEPLGHHLRQLVRHHLNQVITLKYRTGLVPFIVEVNGVEVTPEDLPGSIDALCHLFQAAWLGAWFYERNQSDTCSVCNHTVNEHRCSNPDCQTHIMTNDIFGPIEPVERKLKRTGTDG